jgi:thioredoxin-like negative regulator of GroEL
VAIANLHPCYRVCFDDGPIEDSWFKLHPVIVKEYGNQVETFLDAWQEEPERRIVLATLIGDWAFVKQAAESQGLVELADRAAEQAEQSRRRWVNMARVAWDNQQDTDALCTLANARAEDLSECLKIACEKHLLWDEDVAIVSRHPAWDQEMYEACQALAPPV